MWKPGPGTVCRAGLEEGSFTSLLKIGAWRWRAVMRVGPVSIRLMP